MRGLDRSAVVVARAAVSSATWRVTRRRRLCAACAGSACRRRCWPRSTVRSGAKPRSTMPAGKSHRRDSPALARRARPLGFCNAPRRELYRELTARWIKYGLALDAGLVGTERLSVDLLRSPTNKSSVASRSKRRSSLPTSATKPAFAKRSTSVTRSATSKRRHRNGVLPARRSRRARHARRVVAIGGSPPLHGRVRRADRRLRSRLFRCRRCRRWTRKRSSRGSRATKSAPPAGRRAFVLLREIGVTVADPGVDSAAIAAAFAFLESASAARTPLA